jgi:glyoxylase-like metal-dependent hydrolase (beta-lactamase superfamily II)
MLRGAENVMSHLSWKVGAVSITRVEETCNALPAAGLFAKATPEALERHAEWLRPGFMDEKGNFLLSIHALVVESQGKRILVDTCVGDHALPGFEGMTNLGFLHDLAAAGFPRSSIDVVLCTHLHFDHVGWNTVVVDGRRVPTFPSARYLFARAEWEHWSAREDRGYASTLDDAVRPVIDAGLADLVETDHRITDEVWLEPTPGHTPGHVSVRIASRGEQGLITGDMSHHPVQWAEPDWVLDADSDSEQAVRTRRRLIAEHADRGTLVIGTHYAPPTAGRIVTVMGGTRFAAQRS